MTMSVTQREEVGGLLAWALERSHGWDKYGLSLLQMALHPDADPWPLWQAAVTVATRGEHDGPLAHCVMAVGAALLGPSKRYEFAINAASDHFNFAPLTYEALREEYRARARRDAGRD